MQKKNGFNYLKKTWGSDMKQNSKYLTGNGWSIWYALNENL